MWSVSKILVGLYDQRRRSLARPRASLPPCRHHHQTTWLTWTSACDSQNRPRFWATSCRPSLQTPASRRPCSLCDAWSAMDMISSCVTMNSTSTASARRSSYASCGRVAVPDIYATSSARAPVPAERYMRTCPSSLPVMKRCPAAISVDDPISSLVPSIESGCHATPHIGVFWVCVIMHSMGDVPRSHNRTT